MRRSVPRPHAARTLPWSMTRTRLPGSEVSISMPLTHGSIQHVQRAKTPSVIQAIAHESERPDPLRLHVHSFINARIVVSHSSVARQMVNFTKKHILP